MHDPYLYKGTEILKNIANVRFPMLYHEMLAEYTSLRLAELAVMEEDPVFDSSGLMEMHRYIYQDIFSWAGELRKINIEKAEPILGGLSVDYSGHYFIQMELKVLMEEMNAFNWEQAEIADVIKRFSEYMARMWKIHPFREGNTMAVITFCNRFIESKGIYIHSGLFYNNADYLRKALVAAGAYYSNIIGDRSKTDYLEKFNEDALVTGWEIRTEVEKQLVRIGLPASKENIKRVMNENRLRGKSQDDRTLKKFMNT